MTQFTRTLALLLALAPLSARAATRIEYWQTATGGTYYAYPVDQSLASWLTYRAALTEGSGANVGRYSMSLNDANGTAWVIFSGASQPASWDLWVASVDISDEVIQDAIDDIEGGGGAIIPVNQEVVPTSRKWVLVESDEGLVGELDRVLPVGDSKTFAVDFKVDLPTNGRLVSIDSIVVVDDDGVEVVDEGGVEFAESEPDRGVDKSEARFKITAAESGTYRIKIGVSSRSGDGLDASTGIVTLVVP